ncbi:MAG: porin [Elainellaceae cyanobacterium]
MVNLEDLGYPYPDTSQSQPLDLPTATAFWEQHNGLTDASVPASEQSATLPRLEPLDTLASSQSTSELAYSPENLFNRPDFDEDSSPGRDRDGVLARAVEPQHFNATDSFAFLPSSAAPLAQPEITPPDLPIAISELAQSVDVLQEEVDALGHQLAVFDHSALSSAPNNAASREPNSVPSNAPSGESSGYPAYMAIATPPSIPVVTVPAHQQAIPELQAEPLVNPTVEPQPTQRDFNAADNFTYLQAALPERSELGGIEVIETVPTGAIEIAQSPALLPPVATPPAVDITESPVVQESDVLAQAVEPAPPSSRAADLVDPNRAITDPIVNFQAAFLFQDDDLSARGRLTGIYPITSYLLVGGSIDLTEGDAFVDSELEGVNINELYVTVAPPSVPNLRFTLGQIDLTSYFDRNSFAKDAVTHFFNPIFQTNPALATSGLGSRQGILANWAVTDDIRLAVSGFSSDRSISDFELDAVAAEVGVRVGNGIIRATYVNGEESGANDGPADIFSLDRGEGDFGVEEGDREEAFGLNAEYFIPEINLGLFARYGHYSNSDADFDADTISGGLNFLDVFIERDRLGLAYGQNLVGGDGDDVDNSDALELFYDFPIQRNLRAGFTLQQRDDFSETVVGFRIRSDFNILP